jgi:hypothetical protein
MSSTQENHYCFESPFTLKNADDISNQRYKGLTSSFTLSEYLAFTKELLAEKTGTIPSQNDINQAVKVWLAGKCAYIS